MSVHKHGAHDQSLRHGAGVLQPGPAEAGKDVRRWVVAAVPGQRADWSAHSLIGHAQKAVRQCRCLVHLRTEIMFVSKAQLLHGADQGRSFKRLVLALTENVRKVRM